MNKREILKQIKNCYGISNSDIARTLDVTRQCISQIDIGKRSLSDTMIKDLKKFYPEAFLDNSPRCKNHVYKIPYCPRIKIPESCDLYSNVSETVSIDSRLLSYPINPTHCRVVTLSDDSLSPVYNKGDKVIVDTSATRLVDGLSYLILVKRNLYIRQIKILPDKVKCISTKNDEDTFNLDEKEIKLIGLVVPYLRF